MSATFSDPFPHAQSYTTLTAAQITFPVVARGLLLSNFSAAAASITVLTAAGEAVTIALGTLTVASIPIYLPIQAQGFFGIGATGGQQLTGVQCVTALWH